MNRDALLADSRISTTLHPFHEPESHRTGCILFVRNDPQRHENRGYKPLCKAFPETIFRYRDIFCRLLYAPNHNKATNEQQPYSKHEETVRGGTMSAKKSYRPVAFSIPIQRHSESADCFPECPANPPICFLPHHRWSSGSYFRSSLVVRSHAAVRSIRSS